MGDSNPQPDGPVVAAVTAVLASGLPPATMAALLGSTFARLGVTPSVIQTALVLALKGMVQPQFGPAAHAMAVVQASYRAAYLVASAVRMQNAVNAGSTMSAALADEMRFFRLHVAAQQNRANAAKAVDKEAGGNPDRLLLWVARMDSRTSPECAAANGHTFSADTIPIIGYPGSVHPHCRCHARRAPIGTDADHVDNAMSAALLRSH